MGRARRRRPALTALLAVVAAGLAVLPASATAHAGRGGASDAAGSGGLERAATLPAGFQDVVAIGNISEATAVAFAPDGTAFVALKTGVIKSFDYNSGTRTFEPNATSTNFADLTTPVYNYWDRGLTGITVDPQFPTRPYVYVTYAYNRDPRDNPAVVPRWGDQSSSYDGCPEGEEAAMADPTATPPEPAVSGCLAMVRVTRLTATRVTNQWIDGWVMQAGSEKELLSGACLQFGSHASGDVQFGPDGHLYVSAGDGASFDIEDYGQANNPCPGDPANEGGSLRAQDARTGGDALGIGGAVVRMSPDTGLAPDGTANNSARLVAYGQRNPWRLTFRPGTSELWSGDVGGNSWEEINRTTVSSGMAAVNRGWPCYEGSPAGSTRNAGWDALDKPICESLYTAEANAPGTVTPPYFSYQTRGPVLTSGEDCEVGTSSVSGVAFVAASSGYPAAYRGSLFFSDYARSCIWRLGKKANGDPDPASITPFVQAAQTPVDLVAGPGGDLYYVDYGLDDAGVPTENAAAVHRIVYSAGNQAPTAAVSANPTSGPAPLAVSFTAAASTDPDGDPLTYLWDLDGDGQYDDGSGVTQSRTYNQTTQVVVSVQVSDGRGGTDTESVTVSPGNTAPALGTVTPASTLTWSVGDTVSFAANATDLQETLPDSAFSWNLAIRHCPSVCHTHNLQTFVGQRTGSFSTPDHEYPSHLLLTVTVTDSQGLTDSRTVQLNPNAVTLQFASAPTGTVLTIAGTDHPAPHSQTFIVGSHLNVTAPTTTTSGGADYTFGAWSDGGARTHEVVAPASATTYTATYTRQNRLPVARLTTNPSPATGAAPLAVSFDASTSTDPDGDPLTYAWDLDSDGQYDDASGATASRSYAVGTVTVGLRVTDPDGGTSTANVPVTVTATNTAPVVDRVGVFPEGPWNVGQTLGFDALATDAQQELPDTAYSFVLERQDCDSGCPRQVVQTWTGQRTGQLLVPEMPYPSHLFMTATVTDDQGSTGSRTVRLEPRPMSLTVRTRVGRLAVKVAGVERRSGWTGVFVVGATVRVVAPREQVRKGVHYVFLRWRDGGPRRRDVLVPWAPVELKAVYRKVG